MTSNELLGVKVSSHSVRKSATTTLVENGAAYEEVRPLLGHKSAVAVFHYHKQLASFQSSLLSKNL